MPQPTKGQTPILSQYWDNLTESEREGIMLSFFSRVTDLQSNMMK